MNGGRHSRVGLSQFFRLQARYKALVLSPFVCGIVVAMVVSYPLGRVFAGSLNVNPDTSLNAQPAGLLVGMAFLALFCVVMLAAFVGGFILIAKHIRRSHSPEAAKLFIAGSAFPESWYAQ